MSWWSDMRCMEDSAYDCRIKADKTSDPEEKKKLLKEAEQYENCAWQLRQEGNKEW